MESIGFENGIHWIWGLVRVGLERDGCGVLRRKAAFWDTVWCTFKAISLRVQRLSRALRSGIARGCLESERVCSCFVGCLSRALRSGIVCGGLASERDVRPKRCALSGALKGGVLFCRRVRDLGEC